MRSAIISVFALALFAAASARTAGLRDRIVLYPHLIGNGRPDPKITDGSEAVPGSHPYIVTLNIDVLYFCGGTLISNDVVLTAAHCLENARNVKVTAGAHDITVGGDSGNEVEVDATVENIVVHEGWSRVDVNNDIAVINLPTPIASSDFIQPINMADMEPEVGSVVSLAGWGKTSGGIFEGPSDVLMEATAPVISDADAETAFGELDWSTKICVDSSNGGVCSGDSGGPMVDAAGNQVGITSFGALGCNPGAPNCFTSIPSYRQWIADNTGVSRK